MTDAVARDSIVTLFYTLTLPDGTVADTTGNKEPFTFAMGSGTMIEGLELALLGLEAGETQSLKIPPQTGYGYPDPEAVQPLPRTDFPDDMALEEGMILSFDLPDGREIPGAIKEVSDTEVIVDFNHPLAGKEVTFDVEIVKVERPN